LDALQQLGDVRRLLCHLGAQTTHLGLWSPRTGGSELRTRQCARLDA
jgi:hypothetical protein